MPLKLNVESLDSVDEPLRALYTEKDGKFTLNVEGVEDTTGLKSALQAERKRASDLEKKVKAWDKAGKTPEEIAALVEAAEAKDLSEAERKGEWEKLKTQLNAAHAKQLEAKDESLGSMRKLIQSKVIDAQAIADIAAEGGVPDLLLPHVQRFVKTDDNFSPIVTDAAGNPRIDAAGNPMTIRALVQELKSSDIFGRAFNGTGQTGSGMQPGQGNGGKPKVTRKSDLYSGIDPKDKKALAKARADWVTINGAQAYFSLPD